jgi:hypothetical protein
MLLERVAFSNGKVSAMNAIKKKTLLHPIVVELRPRLIKHVRQECQRSEKGHRNAFFAAASLALVGTMASTGEKNFTQLEKIAMQTFLETRTDERSQIAVGLRLWFIVTNAVNTFLELPTSGAGSADAVQQEERGQPCHQKSEGDSRAHLRLLREDARRLRL